MLKYIKWELINYFKKSFKALMFILFLFLLVIIIRVDKDATDTLQLLWVPFAFVTVALFFGAFMAGTKVVIDTFRKPTFLLESMIAQSPYKILLTKYFLALIINISFTILAAIGISIAVAKAGSLDMLSTVIEQIGNIDAISIIKFIILTTISTIEFTSLVVLVYILVKSFTKNKVGSIIIGLIIWWLISFLNNKILIIMLGTDYDSYNDTSAFLIVILYKLATIIIYYFLTVKLIENKLEIYE